MSAAIVKRLIDAAARRHLGSTGLHQKGRSRIWFDDRGWSLISVEFQPGFGVGTYLNVGASWLWYDHGREVWTFDEGNRIYWRDDGAFTTEVPLGETGWGQWARFIREQQFADDIDMVAGIAAQRVRQLREQFPDPCATAHQLANRPTRRAEEPLWHAYHTGAACALCGDSTAARQAFDRVHSTNHDAPWSLEARQRATELSLIDSPSELRQKVLNTVLTTRQQRGLMPWTPPANWP